MTPRSVAIPRTWKTFNLGSMFAAFLYPAIGLVLMLSILGVGIWSGSVSLSWSYLFAGVGVTAATVFVCNMGIGSMHRIMQHKAGELRGAGQVLTMLNLMVAMQGTVREWVNYHSMHHRFADGPGDPHNPKEGRLWAWVGWILFRDEYDAKRPMALWLRDRPVIMWMDRFYHGISIGLHLGVPLVIYGIVWLAGGSLALTAFLHACFMLGRAVQFHATVYGINVLGHLPTPKWADYAMALLTGGEAFHDHHHDEPKSALHLPRKGILNRIFDYNGTVLLAYEKLGWVRDLKIAPRFA